MDFVLLLLSRGPLNMMLITSNISLQLGIASSSAELPFRSRVSWRMPVAPRPWPAPCAEPFDVWSGGAEAAPTNRVPSFRRSKWNMRRKSLLCLSRSQCFSKILVENVGWTLKCARMVFRFRDWTSQWGIFFLGLEIHNCVARIDTCIVRQRVYLQILSQVCNLAMSETLVCWFFFQVIITILKRARHIIGDLKLALTMTDYKAWRWNEISCNSCFIPLCPGLCVDLPVQVFVGLHLRPAMWAHGPKTGLQPRPNFSKWRCKGQHQYSLRSLLVWISI